MTPSQDIRYAVARSRGFTQIELIITVALSAILIVALTALMGQFFSVSREEAQHVFNVETARTTLKRVAGTVRDAALVDCNDDGEHVGTAEQWLQEFTSSRMTVFSNEDEDVVAERVSYELVGSELVRTIQQLQPNSCAAQTTSPEVSTLARGIQNTAAQPVFTYLDSQRTVLDPAALDPSQVASVTFSLFIDANPNVSPEATHLEISITPRVGACRQQQCAADETEQPEPIVMSLAADQDILDAPVPYPSDHHAHIPLETGSGRRVNIFPTGRQGTFTNNPQWSADVPRSQFNARRIGSNRSVQFPGNNDHVALGAIGITGTEGRSISLWFKADRFTVGGIDNAMYAHADSSRPGGNFVISAEERAADNSNQISIAVDDHRMITNGSRTPRTLLEDEWYHVVVTHWSGANSSDLQAFINGEQVFLERESGTPKVVSTEHANVYLGNFPGASGSFQGLIDDVRIFDRVLTDQEIAFIYYHDIDGEASYTSLNWDITTLENVSCQASSTPDNGSWSETGTILWRLAGSSFISPRETTEYAIACETQDQSHQAAQSVTVAVRRFAAPFVTFVATERSTGTQHYATDYSVDLTVPMGEVLDLAWSASNATECTYSSSVGGGTLPDPQLIDDGDAGFLQSGFTPRTGVGGYDGDLYHSPSAGGTGTNQASWTFNVAPGDYQVQVTWRAHSNRASNTTFTIQDNGIPITSETLSQKSEPRDDHTEGGRPFQNLGPPISIEGNTLTVVLTDNANGFVIADAVRVEPLNGGTRGTVDDVVVGTQSVVINEDQTLSLSCNNQGDPPVTRELEVTVTP